MRAPSWIPLALAASALVLVVRNAGDPDYVAPTLAAQSAIPSVLSGDVPAGMVVKSFHVTGMCCEGCVGKLYHALAGVSGVREAAVDFYAARAEALVPAQQDVEGLLAALRFDKYAAEPND